MSVVDATGEVKENELLACRGLSMAPRRILGFWSLRLLEYSYLGDVAYSRGTWTAAGAEGAGVIGGYSVSRE